MKRETLIVTGKKIKARKKYLSLPFIFQYLFILLVLGLTLFPGTVFQPDQHKLPFGLKVHHVIHVPQFFQHPLPGSNPNFELCSVDAQWQSQFFHEKYVQ